MKRAIPFLCLLAMLAGCARGCQSLKRDTVGNTSRRYIIDVYSGGRVVFTDTVHGIVNQEPQTDGVYYFAGPLLVEVSGDYILKSLDE